MPAAAQERPFLFSDDHGAAGRPSPPVRFDYDVGVGERAFQSDTANQPEQRIGVQASHGRLTFLARFGIAEVGSAYQSSQSGEALYSLLGPATPRRAGGRRRRAPRGRTASTSCSPASSRAATRTPGGLYGNVLFQKPMSSLTITLRHQGHEGLEDHED